MEYKEYSYNEPTKDLPLKILEAPPPYGKRIVTINIETEGSDKVSVIFAGRIYEFRDRFQAKEIPGGFPGSGEGEEKGKYCRVMKSVDVSEEAEVEKVWVVVIGLLLRLKRLELQQLSSYGCQVMDVLGDAVMKHVACRVTVDGTLPEASPVEAPLIQLGNMIHTLEHADTREG